MCTLWKIEDTREATTCKLLLTAFDKYHQLQLKIIV